MRNLISAAIIILLFLVQLAFNDLHFWPSTPNLVLAYLSLFLLFSGLTTAFGFGLFVGILLDYFSGLPDGFLTASLLISIFGAHYVGQAFFRENTSSFLPVLYLCVAMIIFTGITAIEMWLLSIHSSAAPVSFAQIFGSKLPADIISSLVMFYPIILLFNFQTRLQDKYAPKHESI